MPETGRYEKVPRPESIDKFIEFLSSNPKVKSIEKESGQVIRVRRSKKADLRVFMTNIYTVSLADIYDILSQCSNIQAIVTMSAWNGYTNEAKDHCKMNQVGLFTFKEFLGAVHYDGEEYLNYIPPEDRK